MLSPAITIALVSCASAGPRVERLSQTQPVFVHDGAVHSCENPTRAPLGTCRAAERVSRELVLRSYLIPPDLATRYYGARGMLGAHVIVTRDLDFTSMDARSAPLLQIVDGERYLCPASRNYSGTDAIICKPPNPIMIADAVDEVTIVRAPRSIELFGRDAVGGALVVTLKPGPALKPGTSGTLYAAVQHLHQASSTKLRISVDPRVTLPAAQGGLPSDEIHPYALLGEVVIPFVANVISSEKAQSCVDIRAAGCATGGEASFVAFAAPRVRGDSATLEALFRYWRAPTIQQLARHAVDVAAKDRLENPPVATRYRLELARRDGIWAVVKSSIEVQRSR